MAQMLSHLYTNETTLVLITAVLFLVILAIGTMREKGGAANA